MQRAARAKKPSKSAAALAALQAARAGVKTNHDSDVEMSGDEVARDDDAGDRAEPAAEAGGNVGKRRQAGTHRPAKRPDRKAMDCMEVMWSKAQAVGPQPGADDGDGLLEELLHEMDAPSAANPPARPAAPPGAGARKRPAAEIAEEAGPVIGGIVALDTDPSLDGPEPDLAGAFQSAGVHTEAGDANAHASGMARATSPAGGGGNVAQIDPLANSLPDTPGGDDIVPHANPGAAVMPSKSVAVAPRTFASTAPAGPIGPAPGWQEALEGEGAEQGCNADSPQPAVTPGAAAPGDGSTVLPDSAEALPFFFLDAHYEPAQPNSVFMIGKVRSEGEFVSACVVVRNIKQCLFVIPKPFVFQDSDGDIARLEEETRQDPGRRPQLLRVLHARASELKSEVRERLHRHCSELVIKPVQRAHAFEDARVPRGQQWVLKVTCTAAPGAVPAGTTGRTFAAIIGASQTPLEALLLKRRVMGPSWLQLSGAQPIDPEAQASWCKVEYMLPSPKAIHHPSEALPLPPLRAVGLNIKTVPDVATGKSYEVVAASLLHCTIAPDVPLDLAKWRTCAGLRRVSILRRSAGSTWPTQLQELAKAENVRGALRNGGVPPLTLQTSERGLLELLVAQLGCLDPDFIVGHNIGNWDLAILLQRMQHHKVLNWSRIGRFRRGRMPSLGGGGTMYGGGASQGVMTCLAGRLLVDTYVCSRDLVREVEYSLANLAGKLLQQQRADLQPHQVRAMCDDAHSFLQLVGHAESDAWLALGLMHSLAVVPLTLQLACLSGFLWSRTLQGNRAQRIEMLLLHEFRARKFLLPDKPERGSDGRSSGGKKGKPAAGTEGEGDAAASDERADTPAKSKGPQYAGGLVLEPKRGLYSRFVLLLDFNSLYPSIIQEFNICFTTVVRPDNDAIPELPVVGSQLAPLPTVIQGLVRKRRTVKAAAKACADPVQRRQLDIQQQAIKLTANSMYGCLGFTASRFYCRPLAQLITSQGREILASTVALVRDNLGLDVRFPLLFFFGHRAQQVIYGDTDSIMIATESRDIAQVMQLGLQAKAAVNKRYKLLEIDIDGIFKSMLLLKKKKYAAVKLEAGPSPGQYHEVLETKGLDIVRRDWCVLSRNVGQQCLREILSGRDGDDIAAAVHDILRDVAARLAEGRIELKDFVITKQLTKRPEEYPDAGGQAHVQVALRMRAKGRQDGVFAGDTVPYVICRDGSAGDNGGNGAKSTTGLAARAYHPDEVREQQRLDIDVQYYLANQLHPVVSRLCAALDATSDARLAECLGLDPTSYQRPAESRDSFAEAPTGVLGGGAILDSSEHFADLLPLQLMSVSGTPFSLADLRRVESGANSAALAASTLLAPPGAPESELKPAQLANQATLAARAVMKRFYKAEYKTDDELAPCVGRDVSLAVTHPRLGFCPPGSCPLEAHCPAFMEAVCSEAAAYRELSHIVRQLDVPAAAALLQDPAQFGACEASFAPAHRCAVQLQRASAYHWVSMSALLGSMCVQ